jgi:fatty acid-binding protein DegV
MDNLRGGLLPRDEILVTRLGPAIGTHVGPGCLSVAVLQADDGYGGRLTGG